MIALFPVVAQYYEADVNKEHVIRGNSAVIKCLIPSFVADFVEVVSWHADEEENYFPGTEYGAIQAIRSIDTSGLLKACWGSADIIANPSTPPFHTSIIPYLKSTHVYFNFSYLHSRFSTLRRGYTQSVCHPRQFRHLEM